MRSPGPNTRNLRQRRSYASHNEIHVNIWNGRNSPRVNGKLKLQMNPYNRTSRHEEYQKVFIPGLGTRTAETYWPHVVPNLVLPISPSDADDLVIDFYNKVDGMATNLLDAVRTRKQTIDMVTSNVSKIVKSIRLLKKGKWKKAAAALDVVPKGQPKTKNVPGRWLELQYGWLPLMGDIYTVGAEMFPEPRFRCHEKLIFTHTNSRVSANGTATRKTTERRTIVGYFKIKSDLVHTAQHLGLLNPAALAWEAIPFSFVLDWFLPVGSWLESLTALKAVEFTGVSTIQQYTTEVTGYYTYRYNGKKYPCRGDTYEYVYKRTIGLPSRPFPSFRNPLNITRFANALSLLATSVGRKN